MQILDIFLNRHSIFKATILLLLLINIQIGVIAQVDYQGASVGFLITNIKTGEVLVSKNPQECMTPASITKIITTATALELLGPDFRFATQIEYDGTLDSDGTLQGNLYIRGSGDPTLGSNFLGDRRFLEVWSIAIKDKGIRKITGSVIADASIFDQEPVPITWTWEDMGNYYGAGAYGISVYDNRLRVSMSSGAPGTTPQILNVAPQIPDLIIVNRLQATKYGGDSAYFYGMPYHNYRIITGGVPANKAQFTVSGDIPNPPLLVAQLLTDNLKKNGIDVKGAPKDTSRYHGNRQVIFTHQSPPLSEIITVVNHRSNNMFAETLLKTISLKYNATGTNAHGVSVIKDYWQSKGINTQTLFLLDGSGLSPHNAFSATFMNELLIYMYTQSAYKKEFFASLPIAGKSGTVANLFKKTALQEKAFLKSGSIARVQCYAGYIITEKGEFAVTVMVNNFSGKRRDLVRDMEQWIIEKVK